MQCHCVPFGPFRFHLGNKQMQSGIDFFLLAGAQYNSTLMNKISMPSPVFRGNDNTMMEVKLCKVTRSNVNKGRRFASGTIKSNSLIL